MGATTTYHVEVGEFEIATNDPEQVDRTTRCPVMRSIMKVLPQGVFCASGGRTVTIERSLTEELVGRAILPDEARASLFRLDAGSAVEPFSFDLVVEWMNGFDPGAL